MVSASHWAWAAVVKVAKMNRRGRCFIQRGFLVLNPLRMQMVKVDGIDLPYIGMNNNKMGMGFT